MSAIGRDELLVRYDQAIRLRAAGLSYTQMAEALGVGSPSEAREAYMQARALQIPESADRPYPRPSGLTVAWAAGFFDGEGCVFGYEDVQNGYRRFTFGVVVAQVVPEPLDELRAGWGGTIRAKKAAQPNHSDQWTWRARGSEAAWFLEDLLPHLRVKYESARVAIPCLFRTHRHGIKFTGEEISERRAAVAVLNAAARKGRRVRIVGDR